MEHFDPNHKIVKEGYLIEFHKRTLTEESGTIFAKLRSIKVQFLKFYLFLAVKWPKCSIIPPPPSTIWLFAILNVSNGCTAFCLQNLCIAWGAKRYHCGNMPLQQYATIHPSVCIVACLPTDLAEVDDSDWSDCLGPWLIIALLCRDKKAIGNASVKWLH